MRWPQQLMLVLFALGIMGAGWLIARGGLWGQLGCLTMPWFCLTVGLSILIAGATWSVCGVRPSALPVALIVLVTFGTGFVVGGGMIMDGITYGDDNIPWLASLVECIAFTVVLFAVFWLPKLAGYFGPQPPEETA